MADYEVMCFLKSISDNLTRDDVEHLKILCRAYVGVSFLERAQDGMYLFTLLLQQGLLKGNDLTFLRDLLNQIKRIDLANKVLSYKKQPGERIETESVVGSAPIASRNSIGPYRTLLKEIGDELTTKNITDIKFVVSLPGGKKESIKDAISLLEVLETCDMIGPHKLDLLEELLRLSHRIDLISKIRRYKEGQSDSQRVIRTPSRQPSENAGRDDTGYSGTKPKTPLLPPDFFIKKAPAIGVDHTATIDPNRPISALTDAYPMNKDPRGWCLIISNENFVPAKDAARLLSNRQGTGVDVEHLTETFESLGFKVLLKPNQTASEMYHIARKMSTMDHTYYDCFVCCILSHGALGNIYGADCLPIPLKDITGQFTGLACPSLASKPKLFFIQACRGEVKDKGAGMQATDAIEMDEDDAIKNSAEPQESHFLLGYATPPGYVSWRSTMHGSWYISKLCECLNAYGNTDHLVDIMVEVNKQVSDAYTAQGFKQCPAPVVTLTRKVFLKPVL